MTMRTTTLRRSLTAAGVSAALSLGLAGAASAAPTAQTSGSGSTLATIRMCESGGDYRAENPRSTASGAYQMLDSTWRSLSASKGYSRAKHAPKSVQDAAARELLREQGTTPWNPSKHCWG